MEPEIHPEDPDDEWFLPSQSKGIRLRAVTAVLLTLAVAAGGFWGGVVAEKHRSNGSSTASALASRFAALRSGGTAGRTGLGSGTFGAGGFGPGGAASAATEGTVVGVTKGILYVSDTSGNLVKVTLGPSATITRTGRVPLSDLQVGDAVIVSGSTGSGGAVTATSVRATAQATGSAGSGAGG